MISRRALENASGNDVRYSYCKVKGFCIIEILAPTRNFRNIVVLSLQQTVSFRAITPEKQCSGFQKIFYFITSFFLLNRAALDIQSV